MAQVKITLTRSLIGRPEDQRATWLPSGARPADNAPLQVQGLWRANEPDGVELLLEYGEGESDDTLTVIMEGAAGEYGK